LVLSLISRRILISRGGYSSSRRIFTSSSSSSCMTWANSPSGSFQNTIHCFSFLKILSRVLAIFLYCSNRFSPPCQLPVDIPSVANLYNPNDQLVVIDGIYDPVIALAYPISLLSRQFFTPMRPGISSKGLNPFYDLL